MHQNIDQLAQEMTDFCSQNQASQDFLSAELKNRFIQNPSQFIKERWNSLTSQYPSTVITLVTISLLVGDIDGGWCGVRWLRM